MQCAECHSDLLVGAAFCGNCGRQIILPPEAQPQITTALPVNTSDLITPANQSTVSQTQSAPTPQIQPTGMAQAPVAASVRVDPAPSVLPLPFPTPTLTPAQQYSSGVPAPVYAIPKQPSSGISIASLVLGILSILSCLIWFISIPLGIAALICGFIGKPKGGQGKALAGIITGTVGIFLSIIILTFAFMYIKDHPNTSGYNNSRRTTTMSLLRAYSLELINTNK